MAEPEKPKTERPPESPTTARELDFDDEDISTVSPQHTKATTGMEAPGVSSQPAPVEDTPPPQPPRPLSPRQQAENTLREAFPSIDATVVRAVLTASGGQIEPAFNALLGMSDPDSQREAAPPPQPPRPVPSPRAQTQLEADELYARQLAEEYNRPTTYQEAPRSTSRGQREARPRNQKKETGLKPNELYDDRDHSFLDDDLPVIRDQLRKGFLETQSKVNSFISNIKKKIDGDEGDLHGPSQGEYGVVPPQQPPRRGGDIGRRSGDRDRYDADPQVLSDDFTRLQMRDETASERRSTRPLANPDLFKPTPTPPQTNDRRVSFQDGPPDEIGDLYRASPDPTKGPSSSASRGKWQPLAAVDPSPVADHDPFSLGDSDEEEAKKKDVRPEDTERLKKATSEAIEGDIGSGGAKGLEPQQKVGPAGTKEKEAEERLAG